MMNALQEHHLGEFFKIKHGYAFESKYFSDRGSYIVLTPGYFFEAGGFRYYHPEKYYVGDFRREYILSKDDLLVAMTEQAKGLLGSAVLIPESDLYLHNQRLGLITDLDEKALDKNYLFQLLNSHPIREQIQTTASGTKVR